MKSWQANTMTPFIFTDKEKLDKIIAATGITRSQLARRLEVSYKTVYRWMDKGILAHPRQSRDINQLFKEYVDLREAVLGMDTGYFQVTFPGPAENIDRIRITDVRPFVTPDIETKLNERQEQIIKYVLRNGSVSTGWCSWDFSFVKGLDVRPFMCSSKAVRNNGFIR